MENAQRTDAVITGGQKLTTRWWVDHPINRFAFDIYVSRYHEPDGDDEWDTWCEYLSADRGWVVCPVGTMMTPALSLDARLIATLAADGPFEGGPIAETLKALCERIFAEVDEVTD